LFTTPPKVNLIQSPTPMHRLDRLSEQLGIDLWIKRDDLTGFALGGNKGRKLEYLMADVLARDVKAVVTCGAIQSNFIRQLSAACSMFGIRCVAAVMQHPFSLENGPPSAQGLNATGGNVLLDRLFGAELNVFPDEDWEVLYAHMEDLAVRLEGQGLNTYRIPVGGSSPLGAYAFWEAAQELALQAPPFDTIITSSSSGSTQAGLGYALAGAQTMLIGMAADPESDLIEDVLRVGSGLADLMDVPSMGPNDFDLRLEWAGEAYGIPSPDGMEALHLLAKAEGILLDPIYTAKAFSGLLSLARAGELRGRVLFWHTGGLPALFAMPSDAG
jgi:D-cysteine desulfhydrase family pyridoxal phosphate-dependent enzyme